ncbi:MAG: hypothetical protein A2138_12305, partial [Deltaproteobacteria bacterium RBG_16_71_12]
PVAVVIEKNQVQVFRAAAGDDESEDYTRVMTAYSQTFDRMLHFAARVVGPDGRAQQTFDDDDAIDGPAFADFILYADDRNRGVDLPDPAPGSVIESVFVRRQRSPELFAYGHMFGADVPVLRSRFTVEVPDGFVIEHVAEAFGVEIESKPRVEKKGGLTRYVWERRDLPALELEENAPPPSTMLEQVVLRLASWTDDAGTVQRAPADPEALSRYSDALMRDRVQVTPEIEAKVRELLADVGDDPRARARRLYAWTRDSIRYCAVEVGMGGFVPHSSADVEKNRYGDCKDKANLLKAMLHVAGIESRIVTIFADQWPEPFRLPVLAGNFNHAILLVDLPSGPVWVDPTTRTTPFDDLPPVDEDRLALPISARGDPLTPTLASDPARERRASTAELTLAADGTAQGAFTAELNGFFADGVRDLLLSEPEARRPAAVAKLLPFDDARVTRFTVDNATPPEEVTPALVKGELQTRVSAPIKAGGDALVSTRALFRPTLPLVAATRKAPVVLGPRQSLVDTVVLKLPAGAGVTRTPAPVEIETAHLRYLLSWAVVDGAVRVTREQTNKVRVVPKAELAAFVDACARVAAAEEQKLVLHGGDR